MLTPRVIHGTPPIVDGIEVETGGEAQSLYDGSSSKPAMGFDGAKEIGLVTVA